LPDGERAGRAASDRGRLLRWCVDSFDPGIGLYVHVPFCTAKCGYCDFNSYANSEHLIPAYASALLADASLWVGSVHGRRIETIFFGGGTPTLNPGAENQRILDGLRGMFDVAPDAEVSIEANPGSVDPGQLSFLRQAGFNRLSIGVQSFDDAELRQLDRIHTADEARRAIACAREAGFDNVNVDLIYGLPGQQLQSWQRTLDEAISMAPAHISAYALTVEDGTPLARDVARGRVAAPDGDAQAEMYEWTQDRLANAGYEHYEISNWARHGRACRHNLTYWRNREYLGLGAGAHAFLDGVRFASVSLPRRYIDLVAESAAAREDGRADLVHIVSREVIDDDLSIADTLILGLRLCEGVDLKAFTERHGRTVMDVCGDVIKEFAGYGLLELTDRRLRLTRRGRLLSNELFVRLLPARRGDAGVPVAGSSGTTGSRD
jgi:oxygen-independent coproporphyrinogen-3 oxidase